MRSMLRIALGLCALATFIYAGWAQQAKTSTGQVDSDPIVKLLKNCVDSMKSSVTPAFSGLGAGEKTHLQDLLDKQDQQISALGKKSGMVTRQQLEKELGPFFQTGDEVRKAISNIRRPETVTAAGYTTDPSYCANHCYQTCGYNGVGEKVCWYTCYRCCSNGGC